MNAYQELKEDLNEFGKNFDDIDFSKISLIDEDYNLNAVINENTDIDDYKTILDFEYNNDYGSQELFGFVVFKDGAWLERGEYDGSEWWNYKKCPTRKTKVKRT